MYILNYMYYFGAYIANVIKTFAWVQDEGLCGFRARLRERSLGRRKPFLEKRPCSGYFSPVKKLNWAYRVCAFCLSNIFEIWLG